MDTPKKSRRTEELNMLQEIRYRAKIEEAIVNDIPVSVLIWGPSASTIDAISSLRIKIRTVLTQRGHLARFSEELVDAESSGDAGSQQLMHGELFDLIVSLPNTYASIIAINNFMSDNRLNKKMIIFLDATIDYGRDFQNLLESSTQRTYGSAITYKGEGEFGIVEATIYETVKRIGEIKFLNERI